MRRNTGKIVIVMVVTLVFLDYISMQWYWVQKRHAGVSLLVPTNQEGESNRVFSMLLNKEVDRTLRHSKRNNNGVSFELKGYFIDTVFITFRRIRC